MLALFNKKTLINNNDIHINNKASAKHISPFINTLYITCIYLCIFIALLLTTSYASNIEKSLKFSSLTTLDGLSQNSVYDITQDQQGFIWIATEDGLDRYDGDKFVHYRYQAADPNSVANNTIRKIFIDNNNKLWVGTEHGLSRYNAKSDNFESFFNNPNDPASLKDNIIWDIYQDKLNNIWVSTEQGLHQYNPQSNNFKRIRIRGFENKLQEIKTIFQDENHNYWMGTYDQGIFIVNENLSYAFSLKEQNKWNLSINAGALFDLKVIENDYWLATDNGLFIVSADYQFKRHLNQNTSETPILSNQIRAIEQINDTHVWLATKNGLNTINLLNNEIKHHKSSPYNNMLSENWLFDLYRDNTNKIWISSYGGGINIYNPLNNKFQHIINKEIQKEATVESMVEKSDKSIWFSTEQGKLYQLTQDKHIIEIPININESIPHLLTDNGDNLWIKTVSNRLYKLENKTNKIIEQTAWFNHAKHPANNLLSLINNEIWYIDTNGLLTSYHLISQKFVNFALNDKFTAVGVEKIDKEILWLVSESNELFQFDLHSRIFNKMEVNIPLKQKSIKELNQTKNITISPHWIWLGSYSQGVTLIDRTTNNATYYDENNLLSNNFIVDILVDDNENAWFATSKGISVIEPTSGNVRNFDTDFFITNTDFIIFSSLVSSTKTMFFGTINGFYQFDPVDILQITQQFFPPLFTDVYIANKKIKIIAEERNKKEQIFSLNKQVNYIDQLTLNYDQSPFSIEFISPNAKLSSQIQYRYRLSGLETNWIISDPDNKRATYTNLSAGDYVFEVQAYDLHDNNKVLNNKLKVHILPPWWLADSSLVLYALIFLLFISYILKQFHNKRQYHLQIKLSEERLKLSLWGSGDEMWDWNIKTGKIFRSNIWGILEFPQDGTRNTNTANLENKSTNIHHHDLLRVQQALADHFDKNTEHFEATYRVKDKSNQWIWVLDRGKVVERDENDKPKRMTGTLKDISQIKKSEERLKLFAKCIENISDAVIIYDRQFMIVDVNKAFQRITGKNKAQMLGASFKFTQYPESFSQQIKKHLLTKGTWQGEIESSRNNNESYLTDLSIDVIRDENNNISHFVGVFSDITQRKETEAELRKLANSDTLTNLPNRSYFQANQTRLVNSKIPHALLVFDLDNFKKINDSLGHEVGDVLLCKVAQRMLKVGRNQDTVYRLGGDEFSILIENTNDIHTITTLAKNILQAIALPLKLKNQEVVLYSSIGIVIYPEDGLSPQELLKNADTAMYHAKSLGGNKYQFFNESMNKQAVKRLQVENLIRHGLKNDLFSVFYQPKIEISTGKIAGMEALVRFETPKNGLVSPVVFIPVSEETGQIIDIGEVVLRKACYATKKWVDAGLFSGRVAVNLSAVQFTQPNLVNLIASILQESRLPAKYLELEITEGTVMDSPQKAIDTMLEIRAMGIHLSLDDFGTGYSSLAYLKKFPLNTLKIDKAFVDDIEHSEQGRNMVATIVTIAHNLDMHVVAEGVETELQLTFLSSLKCEQLQGYLYSRPLSIKDFQQYLIAHRVTDKSTSFGKR